ncbi:MAG: hypothetical protein WCJ58_00475 [bacterium]
MTKKKWIIIIGIITVILLICLCSGIISMLILRNKIEKKQIDSTKSNEDAIKTEDYDRFYEIFYRYPYGYKLQKDANTSTYVSSNFGFSFDYPQNFSVAAPYVNQISVQDGTLTYNATDNSISSRGMNNRVKFSYFWNDEFRAMSLDDLILYLQKQAVAGDEFAMRNWKAELTNSSEKTINGNTYTVKEYDDKIADYTVNKYVDYYQKSDKGFVVISYQYFPAKKSVDLEKFITSVVLPDITGADFIAKIGQSKYENAFDIQANDLTKRVPLLTAADLTDEILQQPFDKADKYQNIVKDFASLDDPRRKYLKLIQINAIFKAKTDDAKYFVGNSASFEIYDFRLIDKKDNFHPTQRLYTLTITGTFKGELKNLNDILVYLDGKQVPESDFASKQIDYNDSYFKLVINKGLTATTTFNSAKLVATDFADQESGNCEIKKIDNKFYPN